MSDREPMSSTLTLESGLMPVAPGDVVGGKYRVERVLGRGGMGIVVAATHVHLRELVALKFLLTPGGQTSQVMARFLREAQITAKMRGQHVARVTDVGVLPNQVPYMVMEYLEGSDLRRIVRSRGPLPVEEAVDYVVQACEGVAEAHALGVVHRDLKPSNLFVSTGRDGAPLVKVLDFGVSKLSQLLDEAAQELTGTGMLLGSPRYMSPEQLRSSASVDGR